MNKKTKKEMREIAKKRLTLALLGISLQILLIGIAAGGIHLGGGSWADKVFAGGTVLVFGSIVHMPLQVYLYDFWKEYETAQDDPPQEKSAPKPGQWQDDK